MAKNTVNSVCFQSLFNCFVSVQDPRVPGRCLHPLINIVMITLCGFLCGANTWKGIEMVAKKRQRWLSRFLDLSNGIPSHQTLGRVFSLLDPESLKSKLSQWVSELCQWCQEEIINVDGKTLRHSYHKKSGKKALHIVNAFSPRHKITLGEIKTPDKSNEIKGIPLLLKSLDLQGKIITIDAMGTQKGIANLIRKKQAHYVLALKKNHRRFYKKTQSLFEKIEQQNFQDVLHQQWCDENYAHGRIEKREYTVVPSMYLSAYQKHWPDLSVLVRVNTTRETSQGTQQATRYYLSSIPYKKYHKTTQAIRQHWSVENSLHWKLDMGLEEDACPIHRGNAAENLASMRKCVLALLERENATENGIALKRLQAAMSTRYLSKLIGL